MRADGRDGLEFTQSVGLNAANGGKGHHASSLAIAFLPLRITSVLNEMSFTAKVGTCAMEGAQASKQTPVIPQACISAVGSTNVVSKA
jgi:hypothetical protein